MITNSSSLYYAHTYRFVCILYNTNTRGIYNIYKFVTNFKVYNIMYCTHGQGRSALWSGRSLEAATQQVGPVLFFAGARLRRAECVRNRARARGPESGQRHRCAGVPEHVRPHGAVYRFGLETNQRIIYGHENYIFMKRG